MTPNSMRSFAGGLIIAGTLCGIAYFNGPAEAAKDTKKVEKTSQIEKLSEEEMIDQLTSKGYVVQTESEWNNELAAAKKTAEKDEAEKKEEVEKKDENDKKEQPETEQEVVYRTIINVTSGMTSIDVGKSLQHAKIIDDAFQFSKEVEKKGVATKMKLGIYEIDSSMTTDEIISIIFKS